MFRIVALFLLLLGELIFILPVCASVAFEVDVPNIYMENPPAVNQQEYRQEQLSAIKNAVDLSEKEQDFVSSELKKYEEISFTTWIQTRQILDAVAKERRSKKVEETSSQAYLNSLIKLADQRYQAEVNFLNNLSKELGAHKALLVYTTYRNFKAGAAKQIRYSSK